MIWGEPSQSTILTSRALSCLARPDLFPLPCLRPRSEGIQDLVTTWDPMEQYCRLFNLTRALSVITHGERHEK
jgi:hypothetical protein